MEQFKKCVSNGICSYLEEISSLALRMKGRKILRSKGKDVRESRGDREGNGHHGENFDSRDSSKESNLSAVWCCCFPPSLTHVREHTQGFMLAEQVFCPSVLSLWFD